MENKLDLKLIQTDDRMYGLITITRDAQEEELKDIGGYINHYVEYFRSKSIIELERKQNVQQT